MTTPHEGRSSQRYGAVEIGLRDVYDEVQKVARGYGELAGKLDTAVSMYALRFDAVNRELAETGKEISDHELRLRAVEQRPVVTPRAMWAAIGVLTGIVSVALAIISQVVK